MKSSSVAPYDDVPESAIQASKKSEDSNQSHQDDAELTLIRNQLKQIETQQSSLVDLLHVSLNNPLLLFDLYRVMRSFTLRCQIDCFVSSHSLADEFFP